MVNLCDERPVIFRRIARPIAQPGLSRSFQRSTAARERGPTPTLAAFRINGQPSASLHDASSAQPLATLQHSMFCSVMKAHKQFSNFDCRVAILKRQRRTGLNAFSFPKIANLKPKIPLVAPPEFNSHCPSSFHLCASRRTLSQCAPFAARLHL